MVIFHSYVNVYQRVTIPSHQRNPSTVNISQLSWTFKSHNGTCPNLVFAPCNGVRLSLFGGSQRRKRCTPLLPKVRPVFKQPTTKGWRSLAAVLPWRRWRGIDALKVGQGILMYSAYGAHLGKFNWKSKHTFNNQKVKSQNIENDRQRYSMSGAKIHVASNRTLRSELRWSCAELGQFLPRSPARWCPKEVGW
jgi:hypothetical protein